MNYFKKIFSSRNLFLMIIGDAVIITSSFYLSVLFRFDFSIPLYLSNLLNSQSLLFIVFVKILWFRSFSLYKGMWRYTSVWDMFNIIKANFLATTCLILVAYYFTGFENMSRSLFIIDLIFTTGIVCVSRLVIRMFFSHSSSSTMNKNKKKILLIGAGDTGQTILRQTLQNYIGPVEVVAFLDDNPKKIDRELHGVPIIGNVSSILNISVLYDEIYICAPSASRDEMRAIVQQCKKTNKPFKTLPSLSELIEGKVSLSQFREVSLVDLLGRKEITLDKSSLNKFIKGKRVLVTGAGGSIGSELVRQCIKFEPSILVLMDISELNLFEIDREIMADDSAILFKPVLADIRDYSVVDQVFNEFKPQVVFHAAAYKHVPMQEYFPWEAIKTNVYGTSNVADISIKYDVDKFVLVSTDKAVKPVNVMGATKRLAEIITQNYNNINNHTDFMAVRFGNVLGSSGSVIPIFQEQIKKGGPVTITDPDMERYFMSIPEASQLILQAGSLGLGGEVFILDMGAPIKILDIANDLIRLSGYVPELDIQIKFTGTRPGEKKIEELSLPNEELDKTKHDKIFVLNSLDINEKEISEVMLGIEKLKSGLSGKTANQVRSMLSSILPEYKPDTSLKDPIYLKLKAEA
jgi:FlaA1/EpsC-like NDP-sugar epimerase